VLPSFTHSGALPPYLGATPAAAGAMSPYIATMSEFVRQFATSPARSAILSRLLAYRKAVRGLGIVNGFQWLDGSFVEDVEAGRGRPPSDIDLVTFARRPITHKSVAAWMALWGRHGSLFDPKRAKNLYSCDAYFVDLDTPQEWVVAQTSYWFGLFTHQKFTDLWKGMVCVPLQSDDVAAGKLL
jgi:hypothetical protein